MPVIDKTVASLIQLSGRSRRTTFTRAGVRLSSARVYVTEGQRGRMRLVNILQVYTLTPKS